MQGNSPTFAEPTPRQGKGKKKSKSKKQTQLRNEANRLMGLNLLDRLTDIPMDHDPMRLRQIPTHMAQTPIHVEEQQRQQTGGEVTDSQENVAASSPQESRLPDILNRDPTQINSTQHVKNTENIENRMKPMGSQPQLPGEENKDPEDQGFEDLMPWEDQHDVPGLSNITVNQSNLPLLGQEIRRNQDIQYEEEKLEIPVLQAPEEQGKTEIISGFAESCRSENSDLPDLVSPKDIETSRGQPKDPPKYLDIDEELHCTHPPAKKGNLEISQPVSLSANIKPKSGEKRQKQKKQSFYILQGPQIEDQEAIPIPVKRRTSSKLSPNKGQTYQPRRPSKFNGAPELQRALMERMEQGNLTIHNKDSGNSSSNSYSESSDSNEDKQKSAGSQGKKDAPKEFEDENQFDVSETSSNMTNTAQTTDRMEESITKEEMDMSTIVTFEDTNINQLIHHNRSSGTFADIWSLFRMIALIYNFISVWYFLGMVGFPDGVWLFVEILVEIFQVADFLLVYSLKGLMPNQLRTMWILQEKLTTHKWLYLMAEFIGCIPQSFMFSMIYRNNLEQLTSLKIAILRALKLLRLRHLYKIFETKEIEAEYSPTKINQRMKSISVVVIFMLSTHMIGCIWLIVGRIDPNRTNWFVVAKYTGPNSVGNLREVTPIEKYFDGVFFVVAVMTGLGYGNIVPSTNLEWFVEIFIMIIGSSTYLGFFSDFAVEIYKKNSQFVENEQKLENAMNFGTQRNLPEDVRNRIKLYYKSLRLNFLRLKERFKILHELPQTLRSELCLFFNNDLIQKVKFFQLSDPSFILAMCRCLSPQICLRKQFVVEIDQVATKMYFIEQGIVQILATDSKTVIAFQSQGCYFGEIGLLLTHKRSCSVRAVTMCIFMTIKKEQIEHIFEQYPEQGKFLRAVGRQRLQTTTPEDLIGYEENLFDIEDGHNAYLEDFDDETGMASKNAIDSLAKFGDVPSKLDESILQDTKIQKEAIKIENNEINPFTASDNSNNHSREHKLGQRYKTPSFTAFGEPIKKKSCCNGCASRLSFLRQRFLTSDKKSVPWNMTTQNNIKGEKFIIIPFSKLYNLWTLVMAVAVAYFLFIVPFQVALNYDLGRVWFYCLDVPLSAAFILDIFMRSRQAFLINDRNMCEIVTSIDQIQEYYINNMMIYDILAAVPIDYILIPFAQQGFTSELLRYVRIMKLIKFVRVFETIKLFREQSNISSAVQTFTLYLLSYICICHYMATSYIYVGQREYKKFTRFDGQSMFGDTTNRAFLTPINEYPGNRNFTWLQPPENLTAYELYIPFLYLSSCTMGAVMYGDIIPLALSEQLLDFLDMFTGRIFLAFLFAECANYVSRLHATQTIHTNRLQRIKNWSSLNHLPTHLRDRIIRFYEILWKNFRGVRQTSIIKNLPATLRMDVKQHIFKNIVDNWDVVLGLKDRGVLFSIIKELEIRIIPQNEFIVKYGEVAQSMYFIVKGQVNIISHEGIKLASLDTGKYFGEMALYAPNKVRSATVMTVTDISVAILRWKEFEHICEVYPLFRERIREVVNRRQEQNRITISKVKIHTKLIKQEIEQNIDQNLVEIGYLSDSEVSKEEFKEDVVSKTAPVKVAQKQFMLSSNRQSLQDSSLSKDERSLIQLTNRQLFNNGDKAKKLAPSLAKKVAAVSPDKKMTFSKLLQNEEEQVHLDEKIQRVPLRASSMQGYFEISLEDSQRSMFTKLKSRWTMRQFMRYLVLVLISYNIVFIPLQMAFRFDYQVIFVIMEVITVVVYGADLFLRIRNLRMLKQARGNLPNSDIEVEQTMMDNIEHFNKRIYHLKIEIVTGIISILPFSIFFQEFNYHEPLLVCNPLSLLRLTKLLPLIKLFDQLRSQNMQKFRTVEVMITYYIINHILTCNWISIGLHVPDVRNSWLRRIPVLQKYGMRISGDPSDITPLSLYIHSLYFNVNTVSHVAVGDITAVNTEERFYVAILIMCGTFIYCFLFGNIVSIVSDFAPNQQTAFFEKYQFIQQRLGKMNKNKPLMAQINEFFDYIWGDEQYSIEEHFMSDMPTCIRADILLCKYQEAIENSIIFKDDQGAINISLTNSVLKLMQVRIFMTNEFIVRCGQSINETYIILEGEALLVGGFDQRSLDPFTGKTTMQESQVIGSLKIGSHYANDLPNGDFNFCDKAICHIISRQPCAIGVITHDRREELYASFPEWKEKLQMLNAYTFNRCEKQLIKNDVLIAEKLELQKSTFLTPESTRREKRLYFIENHLTYSRDEVYSKILRGIKAIETSKYGQLLENNDVLLLQKMHYYAQEGKKFPIFDATYQEALKTRSQKDLVLQMLSGHRASSSMSESQMKASELMESRKTNMMQKWLQRLFLKTNSRARRYIDFIQFINLLYISLVTPAIVCFEIEMESELILLEIISLLLSIGYVVSNFRTQVLIKGVPTLKIQTLFKHYMLNGLIFDLCGCIPFMIVLCSVSYVGHNPAFIIFIALLRCIRMMTMWRAVQLFGKAEIIFRNNYLQVFKAVLSTFFLGHFLACQWFLLVSALEQNIGQDNWLDQQLLRTDKLFYEKYVRCTYLVYNIVCTVGSGDMFPMTDPERVFFTYMMSFGDVMFALAFGFITMLSLQMSLTDETKMFMEKMHNVQEFMTSFKLDKAQQRRVEQYFAYEYQQKYNSNLLMYYDLVKYLPHGLREEVMYQSFKQLLTGMFEEYKSENLIRQLACVLQSQIFLPGDFIINRGDISDEMYFIAEGSVYLLTEDKHNVTRRLGKGGYFGEIAILTKCRRQDYVQAETFCIIVILKKNDFDIVSQNFPEIECKLRQQAAQRLEALRAAENQSDTSFEDILGHKHRNLLNKLDELSASAQSQGSLTKHHQSALKLGPMANMNHVIREESSSQNSTSQLSSDSDQSESSNEEEEWTDQSNLLQSTSQPSMPIMNRQINSILSSQNSVSPNVSNPDTISQSPERKIGVVLSDKKQEKKQSFRGLTHTEAALDKLKLESQEESKGMSTMKHKQRKSPKKKETTKAVAQGFEAYTNVANYNRRRSLAPIMTKLKNADQSMEKFFSPTNRGQVNLGLSPTQKSTNQQSIMKRTASKRDSIIPIQHGHPMLELIIINAQKGQKQKIASHAPRSSTSDHGRVTANISNAARRLSVKDHQLLLDRPNRPVKVQSYGALIKNAGKSSDIPSEIGQSMKSRASNQRKRQFLESPGASLNSLFRGGKDQPINHTIRRTATKNVAPQSSQNKNKTSSNSSTPKPPRIVGNSQRRLSRVTLGKRLTLSQTAGLKLQWTVTNQ